MRQPGLVALHAVTSTNALPSMRASAAHAPALTKVADGVWTLELWYTIHMKRTNLVLDEELLEEALRLSGERTYSRAVQRALEDFVRRIKASRILELAGSGLWQGDLPRIRGDRTTRGSRRRTSRGSS